MSRYADRNRTAAGKSKWRMERTNASPQMKWMPKTKVAADGSSGSASCCSKDNSSLTGECTSGKVSSFSPETESLSPPVKEVASSVEKLELMPSSCQSEDNCSKHLGSVCRSKDPFVISSQSDASHMHPYTAEDHKGRRLGTAAETQLRSDSSTGSKLKGSTLSSQSEPSSKPSPVACFLLNDGTPDKGKQSEDADCVSPTMGFDICPKRSDSLVKLNPPLHVMNRERRNQIKSSVKGNNIIVLRPGMVLMKGYISLDDQIGIVKACRELGMSDGGFYQPGYRDGSALHLKMMCLGKNWDCESGNYGDTRVTDNAKPPGIPDKLHDMVKKAIQDSNDHILKILSKADAGNIIPSMLPDICIVNFYTETGKLGLHQDKDESTESIEGGLPVVSFSIGNSAKFLYSDVRDIDRADKVILESGDILIFGGKSRRIFHGVASIVPKTAPTSLVKATDLLPGRLNLTFRQF